MYSIPISGHDVSFKIVHRIDQILSQVRLKKISDISKNQKYYALFLSFNNFYACAEPFRPMSDRFKTITGKAAAAMERLGNIAGLVGQLHGRLERSPGY